MTEVKIKDSVLRTASEDMDAFVQAFVNATETAIGGQLNAETLALLNAEQITLLAWHHLYDEVMDGGYVQLIHNGYGAFIFRNPFAVAMRNWGLQTLYTHLRHVRKYYEKYHEAIEKDMSDDDFMALYEQMPEFDEYDDDFIVNEEEWMCRIAAYIDDHINDFATIEDE